LVIEGFSIRNGNPSNAPLDYGAAIFVAGNSGMTLRSCIIENCTKMAIQFGNQEVAGPGSFLSNTIFRNNINGCILSWKKSLIADSCLFENNSGTAFCVVQNYHASNSIGEYRNCVFRNNNAVMTVFLAHGWTAENCLIYNNSASYGTFFLAINFSGTNNSVNHCTVVNNISSSSTNPNAYDNASGIKN
jgi:rRNA processing protein Krr1/Pno1